MQGDIRIKEFSLRLINAMASDFHGRSYLMESKKLIIRLIEILRNEVKIFYI